MSSDLENASPLGKGLSAAPEGGKEERPEHSMPGRCPLTSLCTDQMQDAAMPSEEQGC